MGYVVLMLGIAATFFLLRQETDARRAFDDRRAYELCVTGNQTRQAIVDAFGQFTQALIVASVEDDGVLTPDQEAERKERVGRFVTDVIARLEPLGPRDCEAEVQGAP